MECGECNIRSSVGYCHECEMLLCEECSYTCERCKTTVCKSHIQRTSSGRRICVSCVVHHYDKRAKKAKERRDMRAEAAAGGEVHKAKKRKKVASPAGESLSFESLKEEQGGLPSAAPHLAEEGPEPFSPLVDPDAINARILTGSANARRPVWQSGLFLVIFAWVMCFAAFTGSELGLRQFIFNVLSLVAGLGTVIWTGPSSFAKGDKELRKRSRIPLFLGLTVLILSGLVLYIRLTG